MVGGASNWTGRCLSDVGGGGTESSLLLELLDYVGRS
jgi:hypothetical protein